MPEPLPIKHLHHVAISATHCDETTDFYRKVLGFRDLRRPPFDFAGAWLYGYDMQIHLIEPRNEPYAQQPPGHSPPIDSRAHHFAFAVEDVAPVKKLLEEHGVIYSENVNAGGIHQIFFRDPEGHHLEVAVYPHPEVEIVPERAVGSKHPL